MTPEQFISAYEKALASQQWENVAPLMHPNACVTFSNGSMFKGIDAIEAAYRRNFALIKDEVYRISNVHFAIKNEHTAVFTFAFKWSGIINGQPAQGSGIGTSTIVFENGSWLLIAEHLGKVV